MREDIVDKALVQQLLAEQVKRDLRYTRMYEQNDKIYSAHNTTCDSVDLQAYMLLDVAVPKTYCRLMTTRPCTTPDSNSSNI